MAKIKKLEAWPLPPDLRFDFSPKHPEIEVQRVIAAHVGELESITIEGISQELWPTEWWFVRGDSKGFPVYPHRKRIQRKLKAIVRKLRRGGCKIASGRGDHPGYYLISNAKELEATVRPLLRQAIDELRTIEALTGRNYYTGELRLKACDFALKVEEAE